ncbi:MAG: hypothetical protein ACP5O3_01730 [Candidatus Micrarchaeia archaeon]
MDLKLIVQQMRAKGMSEQEIRSNLEALGVANPDEVLSQVSALQEVTTPKEAPEPVEEAPKFEFTTLSGEEEKTIEVGKGKPVQSAAAAGEQLVSRITSTTTGDIEAVERKLEEITAMLKALQEVNRKILETNRELLLRTKMAK